MTAMLADDVRSSNLIFVYGILKRGHALDLSNYGAKFIGEASLKNSQLYYLGRNKEGVGLRFEFDRGPARGEVWMIPSEVSEPLWSWLDDIEGVERGVYRRILAWPILKETGKSVAAYVYEHTFDGSVYDTPIVNNWF